MTDYTCRHCRQHFASRFQWAAHDCPGDTAHESISDMMTQLLKDEPWRYLGPLMEDDVESGTDWLKSLRGFIAADLARRAPELAELPDRWPLTGIEYDTLRAQMQTVGPDDWRE